MTAPSGTSSSGNATPGNGLFEDSSSMTHHEALEPIQIDANALLAGVAGSPLPINLQSSGQDDGSSFCDTEKGQSSSEGGARVIDEDDGFYTFIEQIYKCNDDVNTLQPFLHPHGTVYVREKVDEEGYTPLHHAVQGASVNVIRFLFELGADPDARNEDGLTPLHLAVVSRAEAERVFSDNKTAMDTTVDDIDRMKRKRGRQYYYNFLQAAVSNPRGASYGKVEQIGVVTALLAGGATVDYPTFECQTALHLAIRQGEIGVLNTLLRAGADPWIQFTAASVKRDRHVPTWPVVHLQHAGEAWGTCVTTPDEEENPLTTMVIAKGYRTQQETTSRGVSSASLHYYKCPMMLAVELGNAIAVESMLHVLDIQLIERHIENKKREAGQPYDTLSVSSIATPSLHSGTATAPSSTSTDPRLLFEEQAYVRLLTLPRCHHNLTYLMVALALGNAEVVLTLLRKKLEEVTSTQLLQFELGDTNTEEGEEAAEEEDTASAFSTNTGEYEMDKRRLGNAFHFAAIGNSSECLAFLLDAFEVPDILQPYFMEGNDVKVLNYFSARDNRYAAVRNQKDTPTTKVEEETENRPWSVTAAAECGGDSPLAKSIHHVLLKSPNAEESLETKKNAFVKDFLTSVLVFRQQQTNSGAGTSVLTVQLPKAFSHSHNSDTSVNSSGTSSGSPKVILSLPSEDGSESLVISKLFYNTRVTNTHARVILRRSRRKEARFNAKRAPPIGNKDETKFLLCTSRKRITTVPPLDFSKAVSTLRMRLPGFPIDLPHLNTLEAAVDALCGGGEALNFKFIDRLLGSPATDSTGGSSDGPSAVTLTAAERKELQQALLCVSRRLRLGKLTTEMEEIYAAAKRGRVPGSHVRALHRQAFRGEGAGPIVSSLPSEDSLEESDEDSGSGSGSGSAPSPGVETLPDADSPPATVYGAPTTISGARPHDRCWPPWRR
ncbi:hypothetical protein AGDE_14993 [Angomonas deanei]|uniref:Ankyrin repeats (3 copies)/Ankyrin repeats (Many copies)/Ankyrin repeat, putative n=1 Tax=Angomonas deanei TaxID=59799 RepID=A0A7G2CK26_9TRYP|nr:hypothetical protein AGDE_14993 [Angomonas deanei]CAD2220218.1 Ankyrin repeats (3 copies)/Ankyrin repeats (many copies)/Ankyrin repeat, putative [Angomonas deanei]|eukprot:EPY19870.1 hypothetical protein AGDE_14993 [Angomonas deanei]